MSYSLSVRARFSHVAAGAHDLIDEQKLLTQYRRNVQELSLDDVIVPDVGLSGWQRLTSQGVHAEGLQLFNMSFLDFKQSFLSVEARVLCKSTRHYEE